MRDVHENPHHRTGLVRRLGSSRCERTNANASSRVFYLVYIALQAALGNGPYSTDHACSASCVAQLDGLA